MLSSRVLETIITKLVIYYHTNLYQLFDKNQENCDQISDKVLAKTS